MGTLRIELNDLSYTEGGLADDGGWSLFIGEEANVDGTPEVELMGTPEQFQHLTELIAQSLYKLKDIARGN